MNKLKESSSEQTGSDPGGAYDFFVDPARQNSRTPSVMTRDEGEKTARTIAAFPTLEAIARPRPCRVAIRDRGKIFFINLGDVVSVQAKGKYVSFQQTSGCYLLRESISVVAERLETHGFIRIHRSVLVNTSFVEEIRTVSTGKYFLRVVGGKEYTVTRIYRKNLKFLAEFWIGTGAHFLA